MALVDYKGYRLIAVSKLPINKFSIVYGSNDGGYSVHNSDAKVNELMRDIGQKLNLRGHQVSQFYFDFLFISKHAPD